MDISHIGISSKQGIRPLYFRTDTVDTVTIHEIFVEKKYDFSKLKRYPELVRYIQRRNVGGDIPVIIDAGANIGASSLYFSINFSGFPIVAVEPDQENFELLLRNTEGLNVRPLLGGIASHPGRMRLTNETGLANSHCTRWLEPDALPESGIIPALTIPEILAGFGANHFPFLVKIDIEGGEQDLFSANTDWIAQIPILIMEPHDWLFPGQRICLPFLRAIAAHDRDFLILHENLISIANHLP